MKTYLIYDIGMQKCLRIVIGKSATQVANAFNRELAKKGKSRFVHVFCLEDILRSTNIEKWPRPLGSFKVQIS